MSTLVIRDVDSFAILERLVDQIAQFPDVMDRGVRVEHSERLPEDPSLCPWVGIYEERNDYESGPRVLGFGTGYRRGQHTFAVVMMVANASSGRECKREMSLLKRGVVEALLSDPNVGGLVDALAQVSVEYEFLPTQSGFIQQAVMRLTATANTRAETIA